MSATASSTVTLSPEESKAFLGALRDFWREHGTPPWQLRLGSKVLLSGPGTRGSIKVCSAVTNNIKVEQAVSVDDSQSHGAVGGRRG